MGFYVKRGYLIFDTSGIPFGSTINSAKLRLYCYGKNDTVGGGKVKVQYGGPLYPSDPIHNDDFLHGHWSGDGGEILLTNLNINQYNDITLNATGRGWIKPAGTTKLCIRMEKDVGDIEPAGGERHDAYFEGPTHGGGHDPKLEIDYTGPTPPTGTQEDIYEYSIKVGTKESGVDKILLQSWGLTDGRNKNPMMNFTLARTDDAVLLSVDDRVIFYRREIGDAGWGDAFFLGYVKTFKVTEEKVTVKAMGYLRKMKGRTLLRATWGNTHVVDKEYPVTVTATSLREAKRIYIDLDSGLPAQDPLEICKVLSLKEYCNRGDKTTTIIAKDQSSSTTRLIAQSFQAREGTLRKIWVKGYRTSTLTSNVVVAIQAGETEPDGTDITTASFAQTLFGNGAGNEGWVELDMINNVSDPKKLTLVPGNTYWFIIRLAVDTSDLDVYLRCATENAAPVKRQMKSDYEAGGWSKSPSQESLFFGIDFEGDWSIVDKYDYQLHGDLSPPRVYFLKAEEGAGDDPGQTFFKGKHFDILYSGQNSARITYWKGKISYASLLQTWAQAYASDIYDLLDISITEPDNKQYAIHIEKADAMAAFNLIRQYAPFVVRIYMKSTYEVVLEIRDELEPSDWAGQWATWKNNRTYRSGFEALANSTVRIIRASRYQNLVKETRSAVCVNNRGGLLGAQGADGGGGSFGAMGVFGGAGGSPSDASGLATSVYDKTKTVAEGGSLVLAGVVQTYDEGVFRNANELIKVKHSKVGLDGEYAIQKIKWSGGMGIPTKVSLVFVDTVYDVIIPGTGLDGGIINLEDNWKDGFSTDVPALGRISGSGMVDGVSRGTTDAPQMNAPAGQSGDRQVNEEMVFHRDDSYNYDNTKYYYISVGTGEPSGPSLGNKVGEALASVAVVSIGGVDKATYKVVISAMDIGLASSWPLDITEIGLATAVSIGGAKTDVLAKSIGLPSGTYDVYAPRPSMTYDKSIAIVFTSSKV